MTITHLRNWCLFLFLRAFLIINLVSNISNLFDYFYITFRSFGLVVWLFMLYLHSFVTVDRTFYLRCKKSFSSQEFHSDLLTAFEWLVHHCAFIYFNLILNNESTVAAHPLCCAYFNSLNRAFFVKATVNQMIETLAWCPTCTVQTFESDII